MTVVQQHEGITPADLIRRARTMAPMIRKRAEENERNRVVHSDIISEMKQTGLFRILKPRRYGGFEYDAMTGIQCSLEFAAADASTSWVFGLGVIHNWLIGMFPLQCQDDVWEENTDAFTAGSYAPAGSCDRTAGGYRITGKWHFLYSVYL